MQAAGYVIAAAIISTNSQYKAPLSTFFSKLQCTPLGTCNDVVNINKLQLSSPKDHAKKHQHQSDWNYALAVRPDRLSTGSNLEGLVNVKFCIYRPFGHIFFSC